VHDRIVRRVERGQELVCSLQNRRIFREEGEQRLDEATDMLFGEVGTDFADISEKFVHIRSEKGALIAPAVLDHAAVGATESSHI
jgi:hypothetical protein